MLGRLDGTATPAEVTLVLPPVEAGAAPLAALDVPRAEIPDGHWLVRLQVDGVESLPELVGDVYGAPDLTLAVSWEEANRDCLVAELGVLRARLGAGDVDGAERGVRGGARASRPPERARRGGERLRADGVRARGAAARGRAGARRGDGRRASPPRAATRGRPSALALSLLPGAHWSALTPRAPLRRWQLVRLLDSGSPTRSPLVADERVLHHLARRGRSRAGAGRDRAAEASAPARLPPSLAAAAEAVAGGWADGRLVALSGPQPANLTLCRRGRRRGHRPLAVDGRRRPTCPRRRSSAIARCG